MAVNMSSSIFFSTFIAMTTAPNKNLSFTVPIKSLKAKTKWINESYKLSATCIQISKPVKIFCKDLIGCNDASFWYRMMHCIQSVLFSTFKKGKERSIITSNLCIYVASTWKLIKRIKLVNITTSVCIKMSKKIMLPYVVFYII